MFKRYWPLIKSVYACIIGAGAAAVGVIMAMAFAGLADSMGDPERMLSTFGSLFSWSVLIPFVFVFVFVCVVVPMLVIGLPIQALLQKHGQTGYLIHAAWSLLGGIFASLVVIFSLPLAGLCVVAGFVGGSAAWLVRRPDKDALASEL